MKLNRKQLRTIIESVISEKSHLNEGFFDGVKDFLNRDIFASRNADDEAREEREHQEYLKKGGKTTPHIDKLKDDYVNASDRESLIQAHRNLLNALNKRLQYMIGGRPSNMLRYAVKQIEKELMQDYLDASTEMTSLETQGTAYRGNWQEKYSEIKSRLDFINSKRTMLRRGIIDDENYHINDPNPLEN